MFNLCQQKLPESQKFTLLNCLMFILAQKQPDILQKKIAWQNLKISILLQYVHLKTDWINRAHGGKKKVAFSSLYTLRLRSCILQKFEGRKTVQNT